MPISTESMCRRTFLKAAGAGVGALVAGAPAAQIPKPDRPPNIVLILVDDQGYGELGCYGSPRGTTPRIDRMAREGMRFTDFYAAPVCGPARASLLTGCYPNRVGLGTNNPAPSEGQAYGLHLDEVTVAEVLRNAGYRTGIIGKWHMGEREFLPIHQGFDEFLGLPWSHGLYGDAAEAATAFIHPPYYPRTPLYRNDAPIEFDPDIAGLTKRYTEEAVRFIETHRDRPFFLYLAHGMVHEPLAASEAFTARFPEVRDAAVAELDWSVGTVLDTLERLGLDEQTLVVYTSDNGSPRSEWNGPLRGVKGTVFEGGLRVPCVMRWPGTIPAGSVCAEVTGVLDFLPTFAALAGAKPPHDRIIDGKDLRPLLQADLDAPSPHEAFYYQVQDRVLAVRSGRWKLFTGGSVPIGASHETYPPALYDLELDLGETQDLLARHPDVANRLRAMLEAFVADIAAHARPIGVGPATRLGYPVVPGQG